MNRNLMLNFYQQPLSQPLTYPLHTVNPFNMSIDRRLMFQGIIIKTPRILIKEAPKNEVKTVSPPIHSFKGLDKMSLEDKLTTIVGSIKRKNKKVKQKSKCKRGRRSKKQLEVLNRELVNGGNLTNEKISEISKETGLSATQVYKWFWDYKNSISINFSN